jgi:cobalt-zinc-cadmium efflux system protein
MVKAGVGLVRASSRIFLEAAFAGIDPGQIGQAMAARPHVAEVHDLHIWEITSAQPALSAQVLVDAGQDCHAVRTDLAALLAGDHRIEHVTLQVDHASSDLMTIARHSEPEHCDDPHGPVHRATTTDPAGPAPGAPSPR